MRVPNHIIISVDLDMWWHCRWATGSKESLWENTGVLFREYYGTREPGAEIVDYTQKVLCLLGEYGINATFFILGEVASSFPEVVRMVCRDGHEISCHGWSHVDADLLGRNRFRDEVFRAKRLLEELTGEAVLGYRAPNLVVTPWMLEEICDMGFVYDSSICPSRKIFGKYEGLSDKSNNPFPIVLVGRPGEKPRKVVEIPIPAIPALKLPACSGIMTRVIGLWWTKIAMMSALRFGDAMYYFHPYEVGDRPGLKDEGFYVKIFLRNLGSPYEKKLRRILSMANRQGSLTAKEAAQRLCAR